MMGATMTKSGYIWLKYKQLRAGDTLLETMFDILERETTKKD